jgi:hypothetical protein
MAFKAVVTLDADKTVAIGGTDKKTKKPNPTTAEGYYLGKRQVEGSKGLADLHFLQTPKGNLGVWGKTNMNQKLSAVPLGTMVRITFTNMQNTKNGPMYVYKVEVDADNVLDMSGFDTDTAADETSAAEEGQDDTQSGYEASSDDADASADVVDEDAEQQKALAAAEKAAAQKAKVQGILKGKVVPKRA